MITTNLSRRYKQARRSGALNLSSSGLTEVPEEALALQDHLEADEKFWECCDLRSIDLSFNELRSLPSSPEWPASLQTIRCKSNGLRGVPAALFSLAELRQLDLSGNAIEMLDDACFRGTPALAELLLDGNRLERLPSSVCELGGLKILRASENRLAELPADIGRCASLVELSAKKNGLRSVPDGVGRLVALRLLEVDQNQVVRMPERLSALTSLTLLDCRQNRLVETPQLPAAPGLQQLFLDFNALAAVDPRRLLAAPNLATLGLRDNRLREVPEEVAALRSLTSLDLRNNDLSGLPPALGYMKPLRRVMLEGNAMRTIRRSLLTGTTEDLKKYLRTRGAAYAGAAAAVGPSGSHHGQRQRQHQQQHQSQPTGTSGPGGGDAGQDHHHHHAAAAAGVDDSLGRLLHDAMRRGRLDMATMRQGTEQRVEAQRQRLLHHGQRAGSGGAGASSPPDFGLHDLLGLAAAMPERERAAATEAFVEAVGVLHLERHVPPLRELLPRTLPPGAIGFGTLAFGALRELRLRHNRITSSSFDGFERAVRGLPLLHTLDLGNNSLTSMPACIFTFHQLRELYLCFNAINNANAPGGAPLWGNLPRLEVVDVSNNRLRSVPPAWHQDLPLLSSLNLENNNVRAVPPQLAALPKLRALLLAGNPQKTVRHNIVAKGSAAILAYLNNKLDPAEREAVAVAVAIAAGRERQQHGGRGGGRGGAGSWPQPQPQSQAQVQVQDPHEAPRRAAAAVPPRLPVHHAGPPGAGGDGTVTSSRSRSPPRGTAAGSGARAVMSMAAAGGDGDSQAEVSLDPTLLVLIDKMAALQEQLNNTSLSRAQVYAKKKELARVRAQKIRTERELKKKSKENAAGNNVAVARGSSSGGGQSSIMFG